MVRSGIAKKNISYNTDVVGGMSFSGSGWKCPAVLIGPGGIDEWERFREC